MPSFSSARDAGEAMRAALAHYQRLIGLLRRAEHGEGPAFAPEELYLIDRSDAEIIELLGFRIRGHPVAMFGAFRIPRHSRAQAPNGRASLAQFLSAPPRALPVAGGAMPQGVLPVHLPRLGEPIPAFMARVRAGDVGEPIHVDAALIDVAFDLRLVNPSEITHFTQQDGEPERTVLRTRSGHVLSGTTVGLARTLHRDVLFVGVTGAWQHRRKQVTRLPTLALNRRYLTLVRSLEGESGQPDATANLAFHPSTALRQHLLGEPFDRVDLP